MNIRMAATAIAEKAPVGKRSIRTTVYGNTNAYIGRRFWRTIGVTYAAGTEDDAEAFLNGDID